MDKIFLNKYCRCSFKIMQHTLQVVGIGMYDRRKRKRHNKAHKHSIGRLDFAISEEKLGKHCYHKSKGEEKKIMHFSY